MPETSLETLAAAVMTTAKSVQGKTLFVGWTAEGLPAATSRVKGLSEGARASLTAYSTAGLGVRKVPFTELVPVLYVLTGPVIDFADSGGRVAEDQVRYTFIDAAGTRREIPLGEKGILRGITLARHPWQAPATTQLEVAVSAVPLYTVFTTVPGGSAATGLAILFDPTVVGATNEPAFRSFVRNTISRLLVLDESQPTGSGRGYLEVAGKIAGLPPTGGLSSTLIALRRLGFIDFSDGWLQSLDRRNTRTKGVFIRALRAMGMVEVDDFVLNELTDPRPSYDVDRLPTARLIDMAEEMYKRAREALG